MKINIQKNDIEGLLVIQTECFFDARGYFTESYHKELFQTVVANCNFVQDNQSFSKNKGTLRGLHFQENEFAQSKLIHVTAGAIWDVAVDLRFDSASFGKYYAIELNETNKWQLFIPKGFAHGFITLQDETHVVYKVDRYYSKEYSAGIAWDDPELKISWPKITHLTLSEQDQKWPSFENWRRKHGL